MDTCLTESDLDRYHGGEVDDAEEARVKEHLAVCTDCARRDAALVEASEELLGQIQALGPMPSEAVVASSRSKGAKVAEVRGLPSELVGGYRVVREIHRGGQGIVYEAVQESTKQTVALKVLLDGRYASAASRRRFEREIELVASLKHTNIVTVYDSGTTTDGRQYCVMDYVAGLPLDEHVRRNTSSVEQVVGIFLTVCEAVHYAHQRGVIHRDLKPSNILVDSEGVPKVLDFGLAKNIDTNHGCLLSLTGQVLGTLPYLSPEQARGVPDGVDVRTDVYALGVILYELLTGQYPYPVDAGEIVETIRHIQETAPTPPIRRWTPDSGIARHGSRRARVGQCPFGDDVQTIMLKALAKVPDRRYQSVESLASDLGRYMAGEPIEAKCDSTWYVLGLGIKRHRFAVGAATAILLLLIGSSISLSVMYIQQKGLLKTVQASEARASRRLGQVRELAHAFIFDLHDQIAPLAGATPVREFVVKTGLHYLDTLAAEVSGVPELVLELAEAYSRLGDVQGGFGIGYMSDIRGALESYRKALHLVQKAATTAPGDLVAKLATAQMKYGESLGKAGRPDSALQQFGKARAILEEASATGLAKPEIQEALSTAHDRSGFMLWRMGKPESALKHYRKALALNQAIMESSEEPRMNVKRNISVNHLRIGDALAHMGRSSEALASYQESIEIVQALIDENPNDARLSRDLSINLEHFGDIHMGGGRFDSALEHYTKALSLRSTLFESDPGNAQARRDVYLGHSMVVDALLRLNRMDEALQHRRQALKLSRTQFEVDPKNDWFRRDYSVCLDRLGGTLFRAGLTEEALRISRESLRIDEERAAANPGDSEAQRDLAIGNVRMAEVLTEAARPAEALDYAHLALTISQKLADANRADARALRDVAVSCSTLAASHAQMAEDQERSVVERIDQWSKARSWFQRTLDLNIEMREQGLLRGSDAAIPEVLAAEIRKCEDSMAKLQAAEPSKSSASGQP